MEDPVPGTPSNSLVEKIHGASRLVFSGALAGAGWMLLACMLFTTIAVIVRLASRELSIFEIVFYRNIVSVCYASILMFKRAVTPYTSHWGLALVLAIAGTSSNLTYGYGLAHLPFSTANALNYTAPIFMALTGFILFRLPVQKAVLVAFFFAFLGVVLLLQPKSLPVEQWGAGFIALYSGIMAGLFNLMMYRLGGLGEPPFRLLFFVSSFAVFMTGLTVINTTHFHSPHGVIWLYIILLGVFTATSQLVLIKAFRKGEPHITNLFSYSTIVYSVFLDIFVFQKKQFNVLSGLGIALILGGGLMVSWLNRPKGYKNKKVVPD
jgi:drug/metabolite transporter (DMT)-like permease